MERYCKVCNVLIHPKRVELGYKDTCVEHSQAAKYSAFMTSDAKDTRGVQIIKDPETARRLRELDQTKGRVAHRN
jgi:hypothetical protein